MDTTTSTVLIAGLSTITAVVGGIVTYKIAKLNTKVDSYHKEVNGMKTQLVEEVRAGAQAMGEKKGAEDNQAATDAKEQSKK